MGIIVKREKSGQKSHGKDPLNNWNVPDSNRKLLKKYSTVPCLGRNTVVNRFFNFIEIKKKLVSSSNTVK